METLYGHSIGSACLCMCMRECVAMSACMCVYVGTCLCV